MTTHEPILARLAALKAMSVKDLKAEWQTLFNTTAPNNSRGFLEGKVGLPHSGTDPRGPRQADAAHARSAC
jgi:hypothetical protein